MNMTRRIALALVFGLFLVSGAIAQESTSVIFLLRDSDRGTDYRAGDVVEVFSGDVPVNLPPAAPFWLVRVDGITIEEARQFMAPEYNPDGTLSKKRLWQIRTQRVPVAVRNFLLANRFVGFGTEPYLTQFSASYPNIVNDTVLYWSEVRTWLMNKTTNKNA